MASASAFVGFSEALNEKPKVGRIILVVEKVVLTSSLNHAAAFYPLPGESCWVRLGYDHQRALSREKCRKEGYVALHLLFTSMNHRRSSGWLNGNLVGSKVPTICTNALIRFSTAIQKGSRQIRPVATNI